jgi:MFS family permease
MTAFALPQLLVGWFAGSFTRKYGKKKTAFISLFIGSAFLMFFAVIGNPFVLILDAFMVSVFISMAFPAVNGAYADYINETDEYEKEIEGLEDFYTNFGFIIGPMAAGFLADQLGNGIMFSLLGLLGVITAAVLIMTAPKSINVRARLKD